jgi:hypothetical protein
MMGEEAEDGKEDLAAAAEVVFQWADDPCSTATIISIRREDKKTPTPAPRSKRQYYIHRAHNPLVRPRPRNAKLLWKAQVRAVAPRLVPPLRRSALINLRRIETTPNIIPTTSSCPARARLPRP